MSFTYSFKALPWDLAILLMVVGGIALLLLPRWGHKYNIALRGKALTFVRFLGALIALVVFYGSFVEPRIITITESQVMLPIEEEFTIAVVSDPHVGPYKGAKFVQRFVDRVNELSPDIILLVGDYVYHGQPPDRALGPLANLSSTYGIYAVMGNHEYACYWGKVKDDYGVFDVPARIERSFNRMGITMLRNSSVEVDLPESALFIAGVDDLCTGRADLEAALPETQRKAAVILLSHDPSIIVDNNALYPHLIVSGHTHAGQIRLPFIGPLSPLPTQLGRSYDQGLFKVDTNTTLAITRGIGESGARSRLFAPPEILLLHTQSSL